MLSFFQGKEQVPFSRDAELTWLSLDLPDRLLGVRMSSGDLPWLLSPGSSPGLSILTASAQHLLCLSGRGQQGMDYSYGYTPGFQSCAFYHMFPPSSSYINATALSWKKNINSPSAETAAFQNIGKVLHLASNVCWTHWCLPENCPWTVSKILKCAHYLEDYSWCAVSSYKMCCEYPRFPSGQLLAAVAQRRFPRSAWAAALARTAWALNSAIKCTTSSHSMGTQC